MNNILNIIAPFHPKKAQLPQFCGNVRIYLSFFFFPFSFPSFSSAFLSLMISLLRLFGDMNPFSFLPFSNATLRFSNFARCVVPFSPISFFCPISFCTHGVRKSSLSQALTIMRSSTASFSTNRILILFSSLSIWMS